MKIAISFIFLVLLTSSCNQQQEKDNTKANVSVSILPLEYFIEAMGGDFIEVNVMVPEGSSPATYEPTPRQMKKLMRSDAYLGIEALSFEKAWMDRFRSNNKTMNVFDLSEDVQMIDLASHQHAGAPSAIHEHVADPHIWVSPSTVLPVIKAIKDALTELYPEHRSAIQSNYKQLKREVELKHQMAAKAMAELENKNFMIFHPALGYWARDYGLNQIVIEDKGKEPSPGQFNKVLQRAKKQKVTKVFVQKQFDVRNAQTVAKELGIDVVVINPLDKCWAEQVDHIIQAFNS